MYCSVAESCLGRRGRSDLKLLESTPKAEGFGVWSVSLNPKHLRAWTSNP